MCDQQVWADPARIKEHQVRLQRSPTGLVLNASLALLLVALTVSTLMAAAGDTIADRLLGQISFTYAAPNFADAHGLGFPSSVALDRSVTPNRIYVADSGNNRVLGWSNAASFANGAPANLVIGQPDFFSPVCNKGGISASSLCLPTGVAVDSRGNLYVADYGNSRVLEYNGPFTMGKIADRVFGQGGSFASFDCNHGSGSKPTADSLCSPQRVAINPAGRLYISDSGNSRVLEYDTPLSSTTANRVFGQNGSFITSNGCGTASASAQTLWDPEGMAIDSGGRLYIADSTNSRVLRYDAPLTDSTADQVYGQAGSFTARDCNMGDSSALTPNSLCYPKDVILDVVGRLYIVDWGNHRVLEFNSPLTSTTANRVFGSFTSRCDIPVPIIPEQRPSAANLCFPSSATADAAGDLFVVDSGYNRLLEYDQPLVTDAVADHELGQPDFTKGGPNWVDRIGLIFPQAVAVDTSTTPNRVYVADSNNSRVLDGRTRHRWPTAPLPIW